MSKSAPRIAIYGRHSTDKQNPTSSEDQVAACMPLVEYLGGVVVDTYRDPEVSGYRRDRPGLRALLEDVRDGKIDIVVSEALDRLARDGEDVAWLGKKLKFDRVRLHTITEGEIDDVKLAVASMLGAMFLSNLQKKTIRGMEAAVLAGRFAGGRAYGYRKVARVDSRGEVVRGLLEIDQQKADVVRRIFSDFASGLSSGEIAIRLNDEGIPGPRGGEWNGSTIRGDPKKLVGILNNPLYRGELVWKRREWRRNPDSDRRERLYRIRDESEWLRVGVADLRIVDDALWDAVRAEIKRRQRPVAQGSPVKQRRNKHLLSSLIRCACCGSNYTISGKDYYRCAGQKERGTCDNKVSIRKGPIETAVLSILQSHLLTPEHGRIFVEEFKREMARLARDSERGEERTSERLLEVEAEIHNLSQNMLAGILSPTLTKMLAEREAEQAALKARLERVRPVVTAEILPHPVLLKRFEEKVADLRSALNDKSIRRQAAETLSSLIESVTIYPRAEGAPEAEVVASVATLMALAANENSPGAGGLRGSSVMVVAGAGFEPATFRL
jgi:site-specific DNA recombinase